jgi:hypothetical protein
MPHWLKVSSMIAVILLALLATLFAGAQIYVRSMTIGKLSPALQAEYKVWREKKYPIDLKKFAPPKFAPDTLAAARQLSEYYLANQASFDALSQKIMELNYKGITDKEQKIADIETSITLCQELFDKLETLSKKKDFTVSLLHGNPDVFDTPWTKWPIPHIIMNTTVPAIIRYRINTDLKRGDTDSAFRYSEMLLRIGKENAVGNVWGKRMAFRYMAYGCGGMYRTISQCSDANRIRDPNILKLCKTARSEWDSDIPQYVQADLNSIYDDQIDGLPIRIRKEMTGYELKRECQRLYAEYYAPISYKDLAYSKFFVITNCYYYEWFAPMDNTMSLSAICYLDLLDLQSALRYVELTDPNRKITKVEDLVPDLIPVAPKDPYRTDGGTYSFKDGHFYSYGQDGDDDKGTPEATVMTSSTSFKTVGDVVFGEVK